MSSGSLDPAEKAGRAGGDASSPIGRLFGLSAQDAALVEQLCGEALAERGVDGSRLLAAWRRTGRLDAALGLPPEAVEAIYARAHRLFAIGQPQRAEPLFRALCIADSGDADHWTGLGICLRVSGDARSAALAFETAARLRPDWAVPAFHQCELALWQGDAEAAARHLARFRARVDGETPTKLTAEARRLEQAIALRRPG